MSVSFEFADPAALLALPNGAVAVQVTTEDMAHGRRFQSCACPIAFALARRFGLPRWNITVANGDVFVRDNNGRVIRWWRMDEDGRGFRHFWDCGQRNQQPAAFILIPQPVPYMDATDVLLPTDDLIVTSIPFVSEPPTMTYLPTGEIVFGGAA